MKLSLIDPKELAIIKSKIMKIVSLLEDTIDLNDLDKNRTFLLPALLELHAKIARKSMPFLRYKEIMEIAPKAYEEMWNHHE